MQSNSEAAPKRVNVQSFDEARYWKAFMVWRLGEFNADLRETEPVPGRHYDVEPHRADRIRADVTALIRGAGLPASQKSRYD
jgi:hypothetical protein